MQKCPSLRDLQDLSLVEGHRLVYTIQRIIDLQLLLDAIRRVAEIFRSGLNPERIFDPIKKRMGLSEGIG